jgi:uncharacterized surface protein with fasciclin (FAS1) repeats
MYVHEYSNFADACKSLNMKTSFMNKTVAAGIVGILFCLVVASCKKETSSTTTPPAGTTITDVVASNSSFTILNKAIVKADMGTTLSGTGPFTLFGPTDSAFNVSGIQSTDIDTMSADHLKTILMYHTIPSKMLAADLPAGPNAKLVTSGGDSVFVTNNASGVFVNGVPVTQANITASNGVIHALGGVLIPPTGDLVHTIAADTSLSFLNAAIIRASQGATNLSTSLASGGIYTVFAPTNEAFRAAGYATIDAINAVDSNVLASILTYHAIWGRTFSSDLVEGATPATVNGGTVTISTTGGWSVKGTTNATKSNITKANIVASNGVIYKIDQILKP